MADQEVIKHVKKVYSTWSNGEHSFWHKLKEFVIEVMIIVFAVSLSIWLHGWSEHRHEQEEAKTFLLGLKRDIQEDIEEVNELVNTYKRYDTAYTYFYKLDREKVPDADTLSTYLGILQGNAYLRPNSTRFNSFQSSGKLGYLEDDSLALNILELYQEYIPRIKSSESGWISYHKELKDYMMDNVKDVDSDLAQWEVLTTPKGKYLSKVLIPWQQMYSRYHDFVKSGTVIIAQIDEMYPPSGH